MDIEKIKKYICIFLNLIHTYMIFTNKLIDILNLNCLIEHNQITPTQSLGMVKLNYIQNVFTCYIIHQTWCFTTNQGIFEI